MWGQDRVSIAVQYEILHCTTGYLVLVAWIDVWIEAWDRRFFNASMAVQYEILYRTTWYLVLGSKFSNHTR